MALSSLPSEEEERGKGGKKGGRKRGGEGARGGVREELKKKYEQQINFFLEVKKIENKVLVLRPQVGFCCCCCDCDYYLFLFLFLFLPPPLFLC